MALPVGVILPTLQIMAEVLRQGVTYQISQNNVRIAELNVRMMELQANIRAMELQVERERVQAQKEILQSLIHASYQLANRKMDFFEEAFRKFHESTERHYADLVEEERQLKLQRNRASSKVEKSEVFQRLGEVSRDKVKIETIRALMIKDFNEKVLAVNLQIVQMHNQIGSGN